MSQYYTFDDTTTSLIEDYEDGYVILMSFEDNAKDISHYNISVCAPDPGNAGFDLCAVEDWNAEPGKPAHLLDLGVRAIMVDIATRQAVNYWLLPRSSIFKTGHMMANSVGVIDNSYRGILKAPVVRTQELGNSGTGFVRGNRYFQIVAPNMGPIRLVRAVKSLDTTERGEGGFGSSGTA